MREEVPLRVQGQRPWPSAAEKKPTGAPPTMDASPGPALDAGTEAAAVCKTVPPNNRCGLDPQCGCGSNETCDVTNEATGATSCVTGGGATLGRPCSQTGD